MIRLLHELGKARSVDEIVTIAEGRPETASPEFGRLLAGATDRATARGDWPLVAAFQRAAQVLAAMRNPLSGHSTRQYRIVELLWATPLGRAFVRLGDQHEWRGWAAVLAAHPEVYGGECLSFLGRAHGSIVQADSWLTDCVMHFLADCHDAQPEAAIQWWSTPANSGEGSELPYEFAIASHEHILDSAKSHPNKAVQIEASRTVGKLGQLLYRRRRGDPAENTERAIEFLKSAVEYAEALGDTSHRANFQQSLANALISTGRIEGFEEALTVTAAGLVGWAKDDEPEGAAHERPRKRFREAGRGRTDRTAAGYG